MTDVASRRDCHGAAHVVLPGTVGAPSSTAVLSRRESGWRDMFMITSSAAPLLPYISSSPTLPLSLSLPFSSSAFIVVIVRGGCGLKGKEDLNLLQEASFSHLTMLGVVQKMCSSQTRLVHLVYSQDYTGTMHGI